MHRSSNKKIKIAIDGHAATGKSSTARRVAKHLGYLYIDSGAMYRAATFYFVSQRIFPTLNDFKTQVLSHIQTIELSFIDQNIHLNGVDVSDKIRAATIDSLVNQVSNFPEVRAKMVILQQEYGQKNSVVMDGRDIGTVVFPDAELKVFMSADVLTRTQRRVAELQKKGFDVDFEQIKKNIMERDTADMQRKIGTLSQAKDAIFLNTTELTENQQVDFIVKLAENIIYAH